jgi:hypothetical protein
MAVTVRCAVPGSEPHSRSRHTVREVSSRFLTLRNGRRHVTAPWYSKSFANPGLTYLCFHLSGPCQYILSVGPLPYTYTECRVQNPKQTLSQHVILLHDAARSLNWHHPARIDVHRRKIADPGNQGSRIMMMPKLVVKQA